MRILAIETSCDETAAAVVESADNNTGNILSNVINSQVEIHARYGGVVPEVAARSHIEVIIPVIEQALNDAKCDWDDIDSIAVTKGPGLMGSLLIGVLAAKTLAVAKDKPLIGVNHIYAHGFAAFLNYSKAGISTSADNSQRDLSNDLGYQSSRDDRVPQFPLLALTVSGGHTTLSLYQEDLSREVLGETLDDAAGEAFDKVAKLLGLPYPGGPAISQIAEHGDANKYKFPIANMGRESLDFSFSGLKTAVLRQVQEITGYNHPVILSDNEESRQNNIEIPDQVRDDEMKNEAGDAPRSSSPNQVEDPEQKNSLVSRLRGNDGLVAALPKTYQLDQQTVADIAASFQKAVVDALVKNTLAANARYQPKSIVVGGGVACNTHLRLCLAEKLPKAIFVPPVLCSDNAAMIGSLALQMAHKGMFTPPNDLRADSSLESI